MECSENRFTCLPAPNNVNVPGTAHIHSFKRKIELQEACAESVLPYHTVTRCKGHFKGIRESVTTQRKTPSYRNGSASIECPPYVAGKYLSTSRPRGGRKVSEFACCLSGHGFNSHQSLERGG